MKWTSVQRLHPETRRIVYRHVGGVTKGMDVEWRLTPVETGTQVVISHHLESAKWWLRTRVAQWIVGRVFVMGIAAQTLEHLKLAAERGER